MFICLVVRKNKYNLSLLAVLPADFPVWFVCFPSMSELLEAVILSK